MMKGILLVGLLCASALVQAATPFTVASKIDTEGSLLGALLTTVLKDHGVVFNDKTQLGTTTIVRQAMVSGEVDMCPEYTGNGAFFSDTASDSRWRDPKAGYAFINDYDQKKNGLVWLTPAPANNTWGIAVNDALYKKGVVDFPTLVAYLEKGGDFKLAASAEFIDSPLALPAFRKTYGLKLSGEQLLVLSGGNTAATIRAAAMGTNGVNAAMVYGTDGAIVAAHLHVLPDTKNAQAVYSPAIVVRESVLKDYPDLPKWFAPVFAGLTDERLQQLNAKIQVDGIPVKKVVADYLQSLAH